MCALHNAWAVIIRGGQLGVLICPLVGFFYADMKRMNLVASFSWVVELSTESESDPSVTAR